MATTAADEHLNKARNHLQKMRKELFEVLDPKTWGHNEFEDDFIDALHDAIPKIRELERIIGKPRWPTKDEE